MRIAYFDCFSGASGDMILGACIDAGVSLDALRAELDGLKLAGYTLNAAKVRKQGFAATQVDVAVDPGETNDLAAAYPDLVGKMKKQYDAWFDDVCVHWPTVPSSAATPP